MMQWMSVRGYGVMGEPAAETVKGGTHGGMMLLHPQSMHFHYVRKQILEGCGWYAVTLQNDRPVEIAAWHVA